MIYCHIKMLKTKYFLARHFEQTPLFFFFFGIS
jgi:hypothetical protein